MRLAVLAGGTILSFLTVQSGLAFMLAPSAPEIALRIDPYNGETMAAAADRRLLTVSLGKEAADLSNFSRRVLRRSPYQVAAMRNVGLILAAENREKAAFKIVDVAARLSLRDYITHAWLLDYLFRTDRVDESIREADITLKQNVDTWSVIGPALVTLTKDRRVIEPLARSLATRPYWRGMLLGRLGTDNPHPDASYAIFRRLKALGAPANAEELAPYFRSAADKLPVSRLYAEWLSLLPNSAANAGTMAVRDGDFAGLDAPPPFNWRFFPDTDVYAERSIGPGDMGNALYVNYSGNRQVTFASQLLVLKAGLYRLTGRAYADDAFGSAYFSWQVICNTPGKVAILAGRDIDPLPAAYTQYSFDFSVPAGCDQQRLELTGAPADAPLPNLALYVDQISVSPRN